MPLGSEGGGCRDMCFEVAKRLVNQILTHMNGSTVTWPLVVSSDHSSHTNFPASKKRDFFLKLEIFLIFLMHFSHT